MRLMLTLPLPPSANHRLMPLPVFVVGQRSQLAPSKECKAWTKAAVPAIQRQARAQGWQRLSGAVRVLLLVYVDSLSSDADNRGKSLADAMTTAGVWEDDRQVAEWRIVRGFTGPGEAERVRVLVESAQGFEELERRLEESRKRKAAEARREQAKTPASRVAQIPGLFEAKGAPARALTQVARVVAGITGDRPKRLTRSDAARLATPNVKRHKR